MRKKYEGDSNIIDAVIVALAVETSCKIKIHYQDLDGSFDTHPISRVSCSSDMIELAFLNGHYDLIPKHVLKQELFSSRTNQSETETNLSILSESYAPHAEVLAREYDCGDERHDEAENLDSEVSMRNEEIPVYSHGNIVDDTDDSEESDDDDFPHTQVKYTRVIWANSVVQSVSRVPADINGTVVFNVKAKDRNTLLASCRDGRKWKRDSRTEWSGYTGTRYRDCDGSYKCKNDQ